MYIEKIFTDSENNEKYFSVIMNNDEISILNDQLEKFYSEKKDLNKSDKISHWMYKHLSPKFEREMLIDANDENAPKSKRTKALLKHAALLIPTGTISGAIGGTIGSAIAGRGSKRSGAKFGATLGTALGAGIGVGEFVGTRSRVSLAKNHPDSKYAKRHRKSIDTIRMANGDMSKDEFIKKHYK